ncbi:MAG: ANTAR domain-containing response regulator [Gemmatimonadaceae bacterium]
MAELDRPADVQVLRAPERFADRASTPPPAPPLRVLVATADVAAGQAAAAMIARLGHAVLAVVSDGAEALGRARRLAREVSLDAVLLDVALPTLSGIEVAYGIAESTPHVAVVLTADPAADDLAPANGANGALDLPDAHDLATAPVAAVLPRRASPAALDATLRLAVANARVLAAARREARQARELLDSRKLIERAKGVLMRRTRCSVDEALGMLERAAAADGHLPLADVARVVLESEPNYTPPRARP